MHRPDAEAGGDPPFLKKMCNFFLLEKSILNTHLVYNRYLWLLGVCSYVFLIWTIYERGSHAYYCFYFVCFWSLARCTSRYLHEIKKPHLGKILFGVNESNQLQILVKNIFCLIVDYIFVLNSSIEVLCHYCWSKNEVCVLILMGKITSWHYPFTLDLWWNYLDIFTEINIMWNWWMFQHMSSWLHLWAYE